ncbi:MAG: glycosyltransferase family 39 protein [Pseudomonadota bacterium]
MTDPSSGVSPPPERWLHPWILAGVVALAFFWQLGSFPLADYDEGAFSEATREMVANGNFVAITLNGEPRAAKPILTYWLQAAAVMGLGLNEWALRLPSALAASAWMWALYRFGRQFGTRSDGVLAALLLSLSLLPNLIGRAATADALLNLWLALTLFDLYRHAVTPHRETLLRVYLWMALGMLTKGPVALILPGLIGILYFASRRELSRFLRAAFHPLGWLLWVAVVTPWFVAVYRAQGPGFLQALLFKENIGRFTETLQGHGGHLGYYLMVLPVFLMPFSGWLWNVGRQAISTWQSTWQDPLERFLWLWFLVVLGLFSLSSTQLPHYLLYGATPLCLLMARHRQALTGRLMALWPLGVLLGVLTILPEAVQWIPISDITWQALLQQAPEGFSGGYRWVVMGGFITFAGLTFWPRLAPWERALGAGVVQFLVVLQGVLPVVAELTQTPVKEAGLRAQLLDVPTVAFRTRQPSFSVYRQGVVPLREPRPGELALVRIDRLDKLRELLGDVPSEVVFRRGAIALVWVGGLETP